MRKTFTSIFELAAHLDKIEPGLFSKIYQRCESTRLTYHTEEGLTIIPISCMFRWAKTPEGFKYWEKINIAVEESLTVKPKYYREEV